MSIAADLVGDDTPWGIVLSEAAALVKMDAYTSGADPAWASADDCDADD